MKTIKYLFGLPLICILCILSTEMCAQPQSKDEEEGFKYLFNGETTEGWRGYLKDHLPAKWTIEGETLHFDPEREGDGGTILYEKKFSDFHLKLEWKISEAGNSGIFYLGLEDPKFRRIYDTAPELQVLDNERHPDAKMGKDGNRKAGSLYDLIPADPQYLNPVGEWNLVEVIHKKGHVIHKMNGTIVVEYTTGTEEWKELVAGSKFPALNPDWAELQTEGYIGLQDHGNSVWFRNIRLKEL